MIENYIPEGKENAITREELMRRTGYGDRMNRHFIAKARERGVPIVSAGRGYFIAKTQEEKEIICREAISRIRALAKTVKAIRATPIDGQQKI